MGADVAYARLPGPPPDLADRLAQWECRGAHADFSLTGAQPGETVFDLKAVVPFVSKSTWPPRLFQTLNRLSTRPTRIRMTYSAPFNVVMPGEYRFALATYVGSGTLTIDDKRVDASGGVPVRIDAGLHLLELAADFAPLAFEPNISFSWSGPDTGDRQELMPFYRLTPVDPSCAAGAGQTPVALGAARQRRYLTAWLGLGPFDNANGSGARRDFIDVSALSAVPQSPGAPAWRRIESRDAFVDLDRFFTAPATPDHSPEWECGYTVTSIRSPSARAGYLELAGSGDALRVWLNGRELSPSPLAVGAEPLHRPIELRAGENALVVQSCEALGAWYFTARITDEQGADLPDLTAEAALPGAPIPLPPPEPVPDVQVIEGFAGIGGAPHSQADYADYRGPVPSWWTYLDDRQPEVTWHSAPVPERKRTVLALTAAISLESGEVELSVDDHVVIRFPIGTQALGGMWETNGYQVAFVSKGLFEGNAGIVVVSIPAEAVTPGRPLELRVRVVSGASRAWFMVKGRPDTAAYEQLSPAVVQGLLHGVWQSVRRVTPARE